MPNLNGWEAEVYIKGPEGQGGWDIRIAWVKGANRDEATAAVASHFGAMFDEIITLHNLDYC